MALSSPPAAPQRGDRTTFADRLDAFITWLINFVAELNIFSSQLNTLAAGGSYSFPYVFDGATDDADPGIGKLRFDSATQNAATVVRIDVGMVGNINIGPVLDSIIAGSSTIKGSIRIQKQGDTSKWILFDITGGAGSGYRNLTVTPRASSGGPNPFAAGDSLMVFLQRSGDKGDQGAAVVAARFSDLKPTGTAGGGNASNDIAQVRTLNTTEYNNIPGLSLASNTLTFATGGKYRFRGRAPACGVGQHQAFLYCTTDGTYVALGSSAFSSGSGSSSDSVFTAELNVGAGKSYVIRHYMASFAASSGLGTSGGSSQQNVFTTLEVEKI